MEIKVRIEFSDESVLENIFDAGSIEEGGQVGICPGVVLSIEKYSRLRHIESLQILEFVISFGGGIIVGVVSNWLYDRLSNKRARLMIEHQEIDINRDSIKARITKIIDKRDSRNQHGNE